MKEQSLDILTSLEPWTTVTLIDGTVVKCKMVCTGVKRVLDDSGNQAFGVDGQTPLYNVNWQQIMTVEQKTVEAITARKDMN